jgi:hypothetical protein
MPQHDPTKRRQMEGNMPQSLRIQPEVMALAAVIAKEQGEGQVASILRQALSCGMLVLVASLSPDENGQLATFEPAFLAKALRRKLAAAVDLLIEHGQLPQGMVVSPVMSSMLSSSDHHPGLEKTPSPAARAFAFDSQMCDDLDALGIGVGISGTFVEQSSST